MFHICVVWKPSCINVMRQFLLYTSLIAPDYLIVCHVRVTKLSSVFIWGNPSRSHRRHVQVTSNQHLLSLSTLRTDYLLRNYISFRILFLFLSVCLSQYLSLLLFRFMTSLICTLYRCQRTDFCISFFVFKSLSFEPGIIHRLL